MALREYASPSSSNQTVRARATCRLRFVPRSFEIQAHAVVDQQSGGRAQRDAAEVMSPTTHVKFAIATTIRATVQVHRVGEVRRYLTPSMPIMP